MAKKSSIEKNNRRRRMSKKFSGRRARLKAIVTDKSKPVEERFAASLKLAELPRNSSATLRELGSKGLIPGLVKSSW
jgi:small subunit ribosomal protein S14